LAASADSKKNPNGSEDLNFHFRVQGEKVGLGRYTNYLLRPQNTRNAELWTKLQPKNCWQKFTDN
jgi:hypothetical protein